MPETITLCPLSYGSKIPFLGKTLLDAKKVRKLEKELKTTSFEKMYDYYELKRYKVKLLYYVWYENGKAYCISKDGYEDYQRMLENKKREDARKKINPDNIHVVYFASKSCLEELRKMEKLEHADLDEILRELVNAVIGECIKLMYNVQCLVFDYLIPYCRIIPSDEIRDRCVSIDYILMHEKGMTKSQIREVQRKRLAVNLRDFKLYPETLDKIIQFKTIGKLKPLIEKIIAVCELCLISV